MKVWCEHCRDHFDRKHYGEDGRHIVGEGTWTYGTWREELLRLRRIEEAARTYVADPNRSRMLVLRAALEGGES